MASGVPAFLARKYPPVQRCKAAQLRIEKFRVHLYRMTDVTPRFRTVFPVFFIAQVLSDYQNSVFHYPSHLYETLLDILNMVEHVDA